MPRPPRCRWIGGYPEYWSFTPDDAESPDTVTLTLDEYETIRLIDYAGLTQEQCASQMGVARTTVTSIYNSARKKLSQVLVEGLRLRLGGGSYGLRQSAPEKPRKGKDIMRIAVTYDNGEIFQHFGHTEQFKLYDVSDGVITATQVVNTNGSGHGALAGFLKTMEADALICGGIGRGAVNALAEAGVKLYPGVSGPADEAAAALAAGELRFDPDARCDHHDHGEGHECGGHEHGEGHCGHHGHGEGEGHCGHHGHDEGHCRK